MKRLRDILIFYDHEMSELVSACSMLVFGVRVLFPALVTSEDVNAVALTAAVPREIWSLVFISASLAHLWGLLEVGLTVERAWRVRRLATMAAFVLWISAATAAFLIRASGFSMYLLVGLSMGWSFIRLRFFDAHYRDLARRLR